MASPLVAARRRLTRATEASRSPRVRLQLGLVAVLAAVAIALAVATHPATTLLVAIVIGIIVLARRSPALALGAAVLLFEFEGSTKVLLTLEGTPLPGSDREVGAAAIDVALLAAVAGVLLQDRFRTPRALWSSASSWERIALGVIAAWLALSVLQITQSGDIGQGARGFRLFQWYTLVALATLTLFARPERRAAATRGALAIGLVVSAYAALRVAIGPADAEREFALSIRTVTLVGETVRAIGSFSSAVGLASFTAPVAVFGVVMGLLLPRLRVPAWTLAGLALVGLIDSYSRAALYGVALGLACGLFLVFAASGIPGRRKLAATGILLATVVGSYGGFLAASQTVPELRERAEGVLNPWGDESVELRFETWDREFDDALDHPLGQGLGVVGGASAPIGDAQRTTDNSFLKVLVEQGVLGLVLFVTGIVAVILLLARRLLRIARDSRPVAFAALAGFVSFLGISFSGEYVEQPGKVVAWSLLGIAAAYAFFDSAPSPDRERA